MEVEDIIARETEEYNRRHPPVQEESQRIEQEQEPPAAESTTHSGDLMESANNVVQPGMVGPDTNHHEETQETLKQSTSTDNESPTHRAEEPVHAKHNEDEVVLEDKEDTVIY